MGPLRRMGRAPALVAIVLASIAGCGGESDADRTAGSTAARETSAGEPTRPTESQEGGAEAPPSQQAGDEPRARTAKVYFTAGEQFSAVDRSLRGGGEPPEQALRALLEGPSAAEVRRKSPLRTQIPKGVGLRELSVDDEGTATVELAGPFLEKVPADAATRSDAEQQEASARLGQITYTLTRFEGIEAVEVRSGGVAVEPGIEGPGAARRGELERRAYLPDGEPRRKQRPKGAKSPSTRALQERLAKLRYLPRRAVDGVPGYRTQQAVIAFQSWEGLARDGIVGPATTAALRQARRPKPRDSGPARRIEVYRDRGVALLIENGATKRAIHVSTGAPGTATPAGTFEVFRKERRSWSVPFQVWLPWASYFNQGIAFHEYADVPTYPASHGCVRVPAPEARGVYRFASLGTTVVVL